MNRCLAIKVYRLIHHLEADGMDDETIMAKFECSASELRRARNAYNYPESLAG